MKPVLTKEQSAEVERIMELALDWLMSWDVTDGSSPAPEKERVAAMHRLKEGVIGIVCKAPSNDKAQGEAQGLSRLSPGATGSAAQAAMKGD